MILEDDVDFSLSYFWKEDLNNFIKIMQRKLI